MGDFNTLLLYMDRASRQKIKKETQALTDIYRTFHDFMSYNRTEFQIHEV